MRCIQLGSSVGCLRVPQVHFVRKHFVRKQTMCKSLYTYLTICFAFEKPRWLLHNTADRAETVFSHLNNEFTLRGKKYVRRIRLRTRHALVINLQHARYKTYLLEMFVVWKILNY